MVVLVSCELNAKQITAKHCMAEHTDFYTCFIYIQISMNATLVWVGVTKSVPTQSAVLCVHATLDMSWILIKGHVLVNACMVQIIACAKFLSTYRH